MPDDPKARGEPDRKVSGLPDHEIDDLADKYKVSLAHVYEVIEEVGNDRLKVEAALQRRDI